VSWIGIWVVYLLKTSSILSSIGIEEREKRSLVVGSLTAVVGFLIAGLFEVNFYDSEVCMLLYFIMAIPFVVEEGSDYRFSDNKLHKARGRNPSKAY
ncbi:MAG: hypothetical protein HY999_02865, partial [Nitrospinae bacterium]|nr:hypothetical protein [Nitrospinota bacterium]